MLLFWYVETFWAFLGISSTEVEHHVCVNTVLDSLYF